MKSNSSGAPLCRSAVFEFVDAKKFSIPITSTMETTPITVPPNDALKQTLYREHLKKKVGGLADNSAQYE